MVKWENDVIASVNTLVKQHDGRDKLFRTMQYTLRLLLPSFPDSTIIVSLEHHISLSRKLSRTMNSPIYFQKGLEALSNPDRIESIGRSAAAAGKILWLLTDHIEYLYRINIFGSKHSRSPSQKWGRISNWLWLIGYLASCALYLRKLRILRVFISEKQNDSCYKFQVENIQKEFDDTKYSLARELIDCGIPAAGLGLIPHSVGAGSGVISSLIALYQVWLQQVQQPT